LKVDHRPAPGSLVQAVEILGEEKLALAFSFELGEGVMRIIGLGSSEPSQPTMLRAQYNGGGWLLRRRRPGSAPAAFVSSCRRSRDSRGCRSSCCSLPGQDKQPQMASDEDLERVLASIATMGTSPGRNEGGKA
jgi:hypothetical protein